MMSEIERDPFVYSDEEALVEQAKRDARAAQLRESEDLRRVLQTPGGRRVIWELLSTCGLNTLSWVPGSFDATAANEGRRSVGEELRIKVLTADREAYTLMERENYTVPDNFGEQNDG